MLKTARITLRATATQEALIRKAAEAAHTSISEFILSSVCRSAENTLLEQRVIVLDDPSFKEFEQMLKRPPQDKPRLAKLFKDTPPWE